MLEIALGVGIVMREIPVREQMHGRLRHLGQARGEGEQQRHRDQEPHYAAVLCGDKHGSASPVIT